MWVRVRSLGPRVEKLPDVPTATSVGTSEGALLEESTVSYREAREVTRIRQELRERLMAARHDGAEALLVRLADAAAAHAGEAPELACEYERWRLRFDLLAP
jgi:hypothetical protein